MTNQECHPDFGDLEPETPGAAEPYGPSHERMRSPGDLDPALLDAALDSLRRYAELARLRGEAFTAYKELDLPTPSDEQENFLDRYLGHWPDRHSFIRSRLNDLGWSEAVAKLANEHGTWPGDLAWDEGVLWDYFSERYGLIERLGGVHAFQI